MPFWSHLTSSVKLSALNVTKFKKKELGYLFLATWANRNWSLKPGVLNTQVLSFLHRKQRIALNDREFDILVLHCNRN